ncbi:MAG: insulinase family protein [Thermoanaerobaculia bacterium]|nr:insulinase family protein [Thermoanaerobaculia bacterium]
MSTLPDLEILEHRLDNGLRIVLSPDDRLPLVTVNLWYHVGSRHERPGRTGLAHLFEHMLFQGSQHVGTNDHFAHIQQAGGVANGSTWFDRTNYYETLLAHRLDLGLWLESDRMGFLLPALTPDKLENQRQVVMNERRQRVDNQPYGRAFERLHELLYPLPHPYHWPVIGYMEDIEAATLDDVSDFFETYYRPNNAVLTLCGDFQPEEALARVAHFFADLPAGPAPPASPEPPSAESLLSHREILEDDVELERIYLAFRGPAFGEPEWYRADLLTTALCGGRSSPLYRDLVEERQLAQSLSISIFPTELEATVVLVATTRPEASSTDLEEAIWQHLHGVAETGPSPEDLERAQNGTLTGYFQGIENLDRRADLISQLAVFTGEPERAVRDVVHYAEADIESLRRTAAGLFRPERSIVLTVVPRGGAT